MKILLLSPYPEKLDHIWTDEKVLSCNAARDYDWADFTISYGHRYIIKPEVVSKMKGRIVNIHTSLLPWNRGAHPNFWSWYDDTPKGVSIHFIDEGVDTGDIIATSQVAFSPEHETLASSYKMLDSCAVDLFAKMWPTIRRGTTGLRQRRDAGSVHKKKDLEPLFPLLSKGWDTPVSEVMEFGKRHRVVEKTHEKIGRKVQRSS